VTACNSICGRAHWEPRMGSVFAAREYCKKDNFAGQNFFEFGTIARLTDESGKGKRNDLTRAVADCSNLA